MTGLGATDAVWNSHHTLDTHRNLIRGCCYNPDPALPRPTTAITDVYFAVVHEDGHVLGYSMNLAPNTPIASARMRAMSELPSDTRVSWFDVKNACAQMQIKSSILGELLRDPAIGDASGNAVVELDTQNDDAAPDYNPSSINELIFIVGSYATPDQAPDC